jgi:catechol 2,3-dioxygenase-like lactoylglutathione lyase family enzyme
MLAKETITAFLATTNGARCRRFYERVLGLRLKGEDEFALAFDVGGVELRIQKVKAFQPHEFTALGWRVPNVHNTLTELAKRGLSVERYPFLEQDGAGVWQAPSGARVAWFKDPDGNLLSITELEA